MMAYDVAERQISGGPGWLDSEGFDISAKAERPVSRDQICLMLQTLLAHRFQLALRRETREEPVYALVVEKGAPKGMQENHEESVQPLIRGGGAGVILFQHIPLSRLAWFLSTQVGRTVLDKTDLKGSYDFKLEYTPDTSKGPNAPPEPPGPPNVTAPQAGPPSPPAFPELQTRPSIFTALRWQLGLKLVSQRGTSEYFTVQRAEKPSQN
jgi:uncharacterized protein (TIGR03435 family)